MRKTAARWIGKLGVSRPRLNKAPRYGTMTMNRTLLFLGVVVASGLNPWKLFA
jgi:hypothetical protein